MILRPLIVFGLIVLLSTNGMAQTLESHSKEIIRLKTLEKLDSQDSLSNFISLATHYNRTQNDSAELYLSKAKKLVFDTDNMELQFQFLREEYNFLAHKAKTKQQIEVSKQRLDLTRQFKNKTYILQSYADLITAYLQKRVMDSATIYLKQAQQIRPAVSDKKTLGDFYAMVGHYHAQKLELDLSLENSLKALNLYEEVHDRIGTIRVYNYIGAVFYHSTKYEKSIESLKKAQKLFNNNINHLSYYTNQINLSRCYVLLRDLKIATEYGKNALKSSRELDNESLTAEVYSLLSVIASLEGKAEAAIMYNMKSLKIYEQEKNHLLRSMTLQNIAISYLKNGNAPKAEKNATEALRVSQKHNVIDELPYIHKLLSEIDSAQGNYLSSLVNFKRFVVISDSLSNTIDTKNFNELQVKYTTLEKEKEIELLNSANKTQELTIKSQRYENYILWGVSIFFLMGITNVFFQYRTKKKNNLLLSEKNWEIQVKNKDLQQNRAELVNALQDKDVLIKEIHHRVKNSLQLITSLLSLQAERLNSKQIEAFVSRSQNRITSMALVHEVLYKGNKMKQINFHHYLLRLVEAAYDSFDFSNKEITYEIEAKGIFFEVETATPLGIIINELVHNAFKHAFSDKTNGKVTIRVTKNQKIYQILVKDNGVGIPKNITYPQKSYGLKLVSLLMKQLKGTMVQSQKKGTSFEIQFTPNPLILNPCNDEKENFNCRR